MEWRQWSGYRMEYRGWIRTTESKEWRINTKRGEWRVVCNTDSKVQGMDYGWRTMIEDKHWVPENGGWGAKKTVCV